MPVASSSTSLPSLTTDAAEAPKKRRGRPPKAKTNAAVEAPAVVEAPPAKRRGRPPKAAVVETLAAPVVSEAPPKPAGKRPTRSPRPAQAESIARPPAPQLAATPPPQRPTPPPPSPETSKNEAPPAKREAHRSRSQRPPSRRGTQATYSPSQPQAPMQTVPMQTKVQQQGKTQVQAQATPAKQGYTPAARGTHPAPSAKPTQQGQRPRGAAPFTRHQGKPSQGRPTQGKPPHKGAAPPQKRPLKHDASQGQPKSVLIPVDAIPANRVGTGETIEHLSFALIKQLSAAGPWRRGYDYYRENQVTQLAVNETGVEAKVRGSYLDFYNTSLIFQPDKVIPQCDCPIEDPWCKHAVALALHSCEQQLWEAFWGMEDGDSELHPLETPQGRYQFQLRLFEEGGKHITLRILEHTLPQLATAEGLDAVETRWLRDLPKALHNAIHTRDAEGRLVPIPEAHRAELAVLQALTQDAKLQRTQDRHGWFRIPLHLCHNVFKRLQAVENIANELGHRLLFPKEPLELALQVMPQSSGQVQTALHWLWEQNGKLREEWPLEEVRAFRHDLAWAYRDHRIFAINTLLQHIPPVLGKGTFSDIPVMQGGKFLFETLPKIKQHLRVDDEAVKQQLRELQTKPIPVLSVQLIDAASMRMHLTLSFSYDKQKVPFQRGKLEPAYVTVANKKKDRIYWLQRNPAFELECAKRLVDEGLSLQNNNNLLVANDESLQAYNFLFPKLEKEGWQVARQNPQELEFMRISPQGLQLHAALEFEESVSHFTLDISGQIGNKLVPISELQKHLEAGKTFFHQQGVGFIEVPMQSLLALGRTLQALDPEVVSASRFRIPTYRSGLIGELSEFGVKLNMSRKFRKFWDILADGKPMEELSIPESVKAELRPYQERGFQWLWFLYSYGLNGILADDMGLGKTLQALVAIQTAKEKHGRFPTLIVCPTTLVQNWLNEIARFCPELVAMDLTGNDRFERYHSIRQVDIVVTSYAILRRDSTALKNYPFRFVILDESQNIKNAESQTAIAAKQLQSQHRICLSGTPIENRLAELWSLFDFLMPGFLEEASDFRRRYIVPIEDRGNREAERRLKKQVFPFILRRMKRDVLQDLPPKTEQVLYCDLTDKQRQLYLDLLEKEREQLLEEARLSGGKVNQQHVFAALTKLRQLCNHPSLLGAELSGGLFESGKFEAVQELILSAIENGHRILFFSQFVEMLKLVSNWLKSQKIPFELLTGQTKNRQGAVDSFNNNEAIPIFLVSLKAGGTGLNLTGADMVIHYDPWWNPAAEDQATDRAHRIGQNKSVHVYRLISRFTVEEKIMRLKARKKGLVDSIISADRSIGKKLTLDDLKDILSFD